MDDDALPPVVAGRHVRVARRRSGERDVFDSYWRARERLAAVAHSRGAGIVAIGVAALTADVVEVTGLLVPA